MEMVDLFKVIADALMSSESAAVCVGLLTVPIARVLRGMAKKWKAAKKFLQGWKMIAAVALLAVVTTGVWSRIPGVEMAWNLWAVLGATLSAVGSNEIWKKIGIAKSDK